MRPPLVHDGLAAAAGLAGSVQVVGWAAMWLPFRSYAEAGSLMVMGNTPVV